MAYIDVKGYRFLIDTKDKPLVTAYKWHLQRTRNKVYARFETVENGKRVAVGMHRLLTACPDSMEVDHINGDTLDNRQKNLRICTHLQNRGNNRQPAGKSGYKGVWKSHGGPGWVAVIKYKGKRYGLGTFDKAEDAARAWNEAATKFRGEFACLNKI